MRRPRGCFWARLAIICGFGIFLALLLPTWFWWVVCAGALLCGGIWFFRF